MNTSSKPPHTTPDGRGLSWFVLALFAVIALSVGADLIADASEGASPGHLVVESLATLTAAVGAILVGRRLRRLGADVADARARASRAREEAERWRQQASEAIHGLSRAIDAQLDAWSLTGAEKEVAWLLLKGLSHKEIASARGTSDRTARDQAGAVYRKAGLGGRAELAAFFLEDLLVPPEPI